MLFLLSGAVESVAQSSEAIVTAEVFDVYRSLLKYVELVIFGTVKSS
jgi:condensin complex subunit 1